MTLRQKTLLGHIILLFASFCFYKSNVSAIIKVAAIWYCFWIISYSNYMYWYMKKFEIADIKTSTEYHQIVANKVFIRMIFAFPGYWLNKAKQFTSKKQSIIEEK